MIKWYLNGDTLIMLYEPRQAKIPNEIQTLLG